MVWTRTGEVLGGTGDSLNIAFFLAMVSLTSSFHHQMSPRSLLDFFFQYTSSHTFRTPFFKVFHKSDVSVLTSVLRVALNFEVTGKRKRGRPKKTWKRRQRRLV